MGKDKYANIEKLALQGELDKITGKDKTNLIEEDKIITVEFKESNRFYDVDAEGNVELYIPYVDKTPGELEKETGKDENGNDIIINKIESIEDLVAFSKKVNTTLEGKFSGEKVILTRDLNFNSPRSYADSTTTVFSDYLGVPEGTHLIDALTNREYQGFIPITNESKNKRFFGIFDGQNHKIDNLYINNDGVGGLFETLQGCEIRNLTLSGNIKARIAGGIGTRLRNNGSIKNCSYSGKIEGTENVGGIVRQYVYINC